MTRKLRSWLLAGCLAVTGAVPAAAARDPVTIRVSAAASLADAFQRLGRDFEAANWQVRVQCNFAGSQELAQQIRQGAPADVFAAADDRPMRAVLANQPSVGVRIFAHNRLALVVAPAARQRIRSLSDLAKPGTRLVLADKAVPAGAYVRQMLDKAAKSPAYGSTFAAHVLANVVSFETNVRLVLTKVALGEADAGIVYVSDTVGPAGRNVTALPVPGAFNVTAAYQIAVLPGSPHPQEAQAFVTYVLSPAGQAHLQRAGFLPAVVIRSPIRPVSPPPGGTR
ncbi:MAG: molybdate ABC transporter substrate-binding protein [Candidatus Sericytochromatia bacterium]|nr:molybdate ABC transporter substrate-binding protein [Candidatus Sericytochromatia bacterium]